MDYSMVGFIAIWAFVFLGLFMLYKKLTYPRFLFVASDSEVWELDLKTMKKRVVFKVEDDVEIRNIVTAHVKLPKLGDPNESR